MSILRVVQDDVEFYTVVATGESGMSESGLGRLCGITQQGISNLLQNIATSKTGGESLKPFLGNASIPQAKVKISGKVVTIEMIPADLCAAIIEYYAFDSVYKKQKARYSLRKFMAIGITKWIQDVTGWNPQLAQAPELTIDAVGQFIKNHIGKGRIATAVHPGGVINLIQKCNFSPAGYQLYLYLEMMKVQEQEPTISTICADLKMSRSTLRKWLPEVKKWSDCADWLVLLPSKKGRELAIQQRLHQELGGTMEARTPIGPVDLLTKTEIIEIKAIEDWKTAFGQVVTKGLSYPKHQKRIHLFGVSSSILKKITAHCQPFDVLVTFEKLPVASL